MKAKMTDEPQNLAYENHNCRARLVNYSYNEQPIQSQTRHRVSRMSAAKGLES